MIDAFANARPYLYHLTHQDNLSHIREMARLFPASILMGRANRAELIRSLRRGPRQLSVDGRMITIRDQDRLHRGNASIPNGYTFEDLIETLNGRVFFWPGFIGGPISYGVRHFERYQKEQPVIIRVGCEALVVANSGVAPRFCRYNSGSPRCSNGNRSPRGPETFLLAQDFHETPSKVVEVTFDQVVTLPQDAECGETPTGPWRSLW